MRERRQLDHGAGGLLPGLGLAVLLGLTAVGVALAAWGAGWLPAERAPLLAAWLVGGLFNGAVVLAAMALWQRITWRIALRGRLDREASDLRGIGGEPGRKRLEGLIRELNRQGAAPTWLEGALLDEADLAGADLRRCDLTGALMRGANLHGALLDGANLSGADLSGADLTRASIKGGILERANLEGAQLAKANLAGTNLRKANLTDVNLYGTSLHAANLERAQFGQKSAGEWTSAVHASVEDWIRERLDDDGVYQPQVRETPSSIE